MEQMLYNVGFGFIIFGMMFTLSSALVDDTCDPQSNICDANANEDCTNSKCVCKPGFSGATGQTCTDIDECASDPCGNGGTCANGENAFTCTCVAGWTGTTCGTDIDECASNPCTNSGVCADGVNAFTCTCNTGWTGATCETVFDCNTHTCQNSGTCETAEKTCSCVTGYTGDDCGTDMDDCKPDPCLNGATCIDAVNSYTCTCATGWKGTKCEIAIVDACIGDPPACPSTIDNGDCSGMDCVCKEGYQKGGDNCVFVPDNSAGKIAMAAVTMLMAVLTNIMIQMF